MLRTRGCAAHRGTRLFLLGFAQTQNSLREFSSAVRYGAFLCASSIKLPRGGFGRVERVSLDDGRSLPARTTTPSSPRRSEGATFRSCAAVALELAVVVSRRHTVRAWAAITFSEDGPA